MSCAAWATGHCDTLEAWRFDGNIPNHIQAFQHKIARNRVMPSMQSQAAGSDLAIILCAQLLIFPRLVGSRIQTNCRRKATRAPINS